MGRTRILAFYFKGQILSEDNSSGAEDGWVFTTDRFADRHPVTFG